MYCLPCLTLWSDDDCLPRKSPIIPSSFWFLRMAMHMHRICASMHPYIHTPSLSARLFVLLISKSKNLGAPPRQRTAPEETPLSSRQRDWTISEFWRAHAIARARGEPSDECQPFCLPTESVKGRPPRTRAKLHGSLQMSGGAERLASCRHLSESNMDKWFPACKI